MNTKKKIAPDTLEDTLLAFHHKLADELKAEAVRLRFTPSGLEVLRYVGEKGNPTMKDIAKHLHITPPSATTIVETLMKKELLKREYDISDRRVVRVVLAPKAWKFFTHMKDKKFMIMKKLFSRLSPADKRELMRILHVLTK